MLNPATLATLSTVRLTAPTQAGTSTGTGFLFNFKDPDHPERFYPAVITNKHVVAGAPVINLTISSMPKGQEVTRNDLVGVEFKNANYTVPAHLIVNHPSPDVDLCGILIGPVIDTISQTSSIRHFILDESWFPDTATRDVLRPVEPVIMVGYPNGLWDELNNLPIVRDGLTGSHPSLSWNGKKQFIIDAACFPGSSGSPVFLFEDGMYRSGSGLSPGTRICLLGILWGGPLYTLEGRIEQRTIPTGVTNVPVMSTMMNLGFVIHCEELLAIGQQASHQLSGKS